MLHIMAPQHINVLPQLQSPAFRWKGSTINLLNCCPQAELGEGCLNLIKMHEILLTKTHLALVLEYASGAVATLAVALQCPQILLCRQC
jgi:hypothetical protein